MPKHVKRRGAVWMLALWTAAGAARIGAFSGSTDAPNFRCEAVICGPGALAQCHSLNEWVEVAQIEQAVEIYLHAIRALQPGH